MVFSWAGKSILKITTTPQPAHMLLHAKEHAMSLHVELIFPCSLKNQTSLL